MFSIITPTFNRAHTLGRVYESLLSQTDQDFDWIIMDDASTDETEDLVKSWMDNSNPFPIQYHKLPVNKGKPNALNKGFEYCTRPITVIADSDDSFIPKTLEQLRQLWSTVNLSKDAEKIATIWTLTDDEDGNLVGEEFPHNFWQVNFKQRILDLKKPIAGEKWHSWRTEVLKSYKMFQSEYATYVPESGTWKRINQDYDFLCINLIHRRYYSSPDGIIQKKRKRIEWETRKYYSAYYQLYNTSKYLILTHRFFRRHAFEYLKARFYHKDKEAQLDFLRTLCCIVPAMLNIPMGIVGYTRSKLK